VAIERLKQVTPTAMLRSGTVHSDATCISADMMSTVVTVVACDRNRNWLQQADRLQLTGRCRKSSDGKFRIYRKFEGQLDEGI
jgi:hypothetical protein